MLQFSANLSMLFTELPLLERFDAAARAGFRAVEMQFPYTHKPDEIAQAAQNAGVAIVLINMPAGDFGGGERGIACLPDRREEFFQAMQMAGEYAGALQCQRINCLAGNVPEDASPEACWDLLVENLRLAAATFAARQVQLLIEPLNRVDNPNFILNGYAEADALLTAVGSDNLALQYDCYHMCASGEDVFTGLERRIGRIGHIQISDFPGRGAPGTGTIDFPRLFRTIKHLPYDGWTGCEYVPHGPTAESFGWRAAAA